MKNPPQRPQKPSVPRDFGETKSGLDGVYAPGPGLETMWRVFDLWRHRGSVKGSTNEYICYVYIYIVVYIYIHMYMYIHIYVRID